MAVVTPVAFFSVLFVLAVLYRRRRWRKRLDHRAAGYIATSAPATPGCGACGEKHICEAEPLEELGVGTGPCVTGGSTLPSHLPHERLISFNQPHFAESTLQIRRISAATDQPDVIQRVNSVASTLLAPAQPSSDTLPYGGRKSSIGSSFSYSTLNANDQGHLDIGERRPSVLTDPAIGLVNVRKVSAGGLEDLVRVRSASQSSTARRKSTLPSVDFSIIFPSTPPLPAAHPFSSTSLSHNSTVTTPTPFASQGLAKSPAFKAHQRPDSLTLALHKDRGKTSAVLAEVAPTTGSSTMALKSPSASTSVDDPSTSLFQAWRGFPTKSIEQDTLSSQNPQMYQTMGKAEQGLQPVVDSSFSSALAVVPLELGEAPPELAVQDANRQDTPDTVQAKKPSYSKITYLADVVKSGQAQSGNEQAR